MNIPELIRTRTPRFSQWLANRLRGADNWYRGLTPEEVYEWRSDHWSVQDELAHNRRPLVRFFDWLDDWADCFDIELHGALREAIKQPLTHVLAYDEATWAVECVPYEEHQGGHMDKEKLTDELRSMQEKIVQVCANIIEHADTGSRLVFATSEFRDGYKCAQSEFAKMIRDVANGGIVLVDGKVVIR